MVNWIHKVHWNIHEFVKKSKEFDSNIGYIRPDIFQSNMRCQLVGRFETWTAVQ